MSRVFLLKVYVLTRSKTKKCISFTTKHFTRFSGRIIHLTKLLKHFTNSKQTWPFGEILQFKQNQINELCKNWNKIDEITQNYVYIVSLLCNKAFFLAFVHLHKVNVSIRDQLFYFILSLLFYVDNSPMTAHLKECQQYQLNLSRLLSWSLSKKSLGLNISGHVILLK